MRSHKTCPNSKIIYIYTVRGEGVSWGASHMPTLTSTGQGNGILPFTQKEREQAYL